MLTDGIIKPLKLIKHTEFVQTLRLKRKKEVRVKGGIWKSWAHIMGEDISYDDNVYAGVCVAEGVWQGYATARDPQSLYVAL